MWQPITTLAINGFSECTFVHVVTVEYNFWSIRECLHKPLGSLSVLQCLSALWAAEVNLREALESKIDGAL